MSRRKLLLADDSITIQKVVNLTFADEGIEVIAVGDGNAAFDRMQETPPDLVMADVNMPGLSGYDLCERIKQNERLQHIPVILLVGSFEPFDEREAARVGADDFLTKPFQSIRQLVNKVTGMLETNENRRATAAASAPAGSVFVDDSSPENTEPATSDFTAGGNFTGYDAGASDDEMIQTSYVGNSPYDEAQKFESRTYDADDAGKTQPLSARDLKDFAFVEENAREFQPTEPVYETTEDAPAAQESSFVQAESASFSESANESQKTAPPVFDFDDFNILDIPFDEEEEPEVETAADDSSSLSSPDETASENSLQQEISYSVPEEAETANTVTELASGEAEEAEFAEEISEAEEGKTIAETEAETETSTENETVAETPAATAMDFSFPPEVIEAIAQKVAEKLSARTASEVAPQVADLIIQKLAEEKLKQ